MKTITKQQLEVLNIINKGSFVEVKKSAFERFYDNVGKFVNGGKSIATAELKGF